MNIENCQVFPLLCNTSANRNGMDFFRMYIVHAMGTSSICWCNIGYISKKTTLVMKLFDKIHLTTEYESYHSFWDKQSLEYKKGFLFTQRSFSIKIIIYKEVSFTIRMSHRRLFRNK